MILLARHQQRRLVIIVHRVFRCFRLDMILLAAAPPVAGYYCASGDKQVSGGKWHLLPGHSPLSALHSIIQGVFFLTGTPLKVPSTKS